MLSRRVFAPPGLALAAVLAVLAGPPAVAEPVPAAPSPSARALPRPEVPPVPRPRRAVRAEAPLPPLCDGQGPSQVRRAQFNHAELEDPGAMPALQSAVQLCINEAPARDRVWLRGPVWRG